jgi:glycosyltransferase involved in cell wall biosynthesis
LANVTKTPHVIELGNNKVLLFVVAYNAETTLEGVLTRIPKKLHQPNVEVLVIDDFSKDATFSLGLEWCKGGHSLRVTVLRNAENQGYGGNQKLGYRYAIEHGFDIVALIHGDGQYAPEKLPELLRPLLDGEADAVFGSRMIPKAEALKGGMPYYKWLGNQILSAFQNRMLHTNLSEFHSGYRLYSTQALQRIPFERNSNDFHFDTDIIIQLLFAGLRIKELPIPTYYGSEICHVNGLKYAWNVFRTTLRAKLHQVNLFYDRKFDVGQRELTYDLKLGFQSSHTMTIKAVLPGAAVLDVGCGQGLVAQEMAKTARLVVGLDLWPPQRSQSKIEFKRWNADEGTLPLDVSQFDQVFLLDIIEHLKDPEVFMEKLREAAARKRPEIIITTANIAFCVTRFMLLLGIFNYGRKGILDRTHTRLFTFASLRSLLEQTGYRVLEVRGIPAPFPKVTGIGWIGRVLLWLNQIGIALFPGLFSYQIYVRARAKPTVPNLLIETVDSSEEMKQAVLQTTGAGKNEFG